MTWPVLDNITQRPATMADVEAVAALIAACERATDGAPDTVAEDVRSDWSRPSFTLAADTLLVYAGPVLVAHAELVGDRAFVHVHPDATERGLGGALLDWTEGRARTAGIAVVGQTVSDRNEAASRLLAARGYEVRWRSWMFELELTPPLPERPLPAGVRLRSIRRTEDDRAVFDVIETAFSEWPDREGMEFEDWVVSHLDRGDTDPDLTLVLDVDGTVIGAAVCAVTGDEGWVQQLAVARAHRGRGLGAALLAAAFREFARRGLRAAVLSTDSRTGAREFYERAGMRLTRSYTRWANRLS